LNYLHTMNIAIVPYGCNHNIYFSPIKFFEYMGAGKPTVATSLGQVKEIIEHEKTGWFYEASNQESLIEAME
ncbi:MAG: glycosyltransferase, partial [Candidatus Dadabacteria bacterium]|nr:glycosyltransferase [Candidatus Dadabacteria bacterium]